MHDLLRLVEQWASDRNLILGSTPEAQLKKLYEEVGEIEDALLDGDNEALIDGIGDCLVVLTILAKMTGYTAEYCLGEAYLEIKDRRGRMIDGVFVKEADLKARGLDV